MKARDGLEISTTGEIVDRARKRAFKKLLQMAPQSGYIRNLARNFQIDLGPPPDGCVRCRLCIRVCKEIVGAGALKMEKRDGNNHVVPIEGRCIGCGTCANLCRTDAIRIEDRDNVRTIMIRDDVIGRHPLIRCEGCGKMFATPKFIDYIDKKRATDHPDVKVHHYYCPTCAKLFSDRVQSAGSRSQKLRMPGHR
jgi:formate hydrogenlyase subunit 6/NADH:ubiquinone oxidoreductase subunit I